MNYTIKPLKELLTICKKLNINYNNKTKKEIIILLINYDKEKNNELKEKHNELKEKHNELKAKHNELKEEYNEVTTEHNEVTAETVREQKLDKFYTIPSIAELCINKVNEKYKLTNFDLIIEPSAGNGSFLLQLPSENCIGFDISPENDKIIKQDFFEFNPHTYSYIEHIKNKTIKNIFIKKKLNKILVIGNPPFGKVSSLAVKFFNHAAEWASVIAFIIPKTFRKISVQNKLHNKFHLVNDIDIPSLPCSFTPPMMVKCCFQIWEKNNNERDIIVLDTTHNDWEFLKFGPIDSNNQPTPPQGADFALRAYGGKCGDIIQTNLDILRPKSWHWIKSKIELSVLIARFKSLDYALSQNTARQNSIGRGELVKLYTDSYN